MKQIDFETRSLSNLYSTLAYFINGFPDKEWFKYTKKQRQDLNCRLSAFAENDTILSSFINELTPLTTEQQYCSLRQNLKAANHKRMDFLYAQRDKWLAFAKRFDTQTEEALIRCIDNHLIGHYGFAANEQTGTVELANDSTGAYCQTIYLISPVFSDNYDDDDIADDMEIDVLDSGYQISFVQRDEIVTVDFTDLRLETLLFDYASIPPTGDSVWSLLAAALTALGTKRDNLGEGFLNAKEKALWPLGEFSPIHSIGKRHESAGGDKKASEMFYVYAVKAGNKRVAELTRQYSEAGNAKTIKRTSAALKKELTKPESESLARMILADIRDASSAYPSVVEFYVPPDELTAFRHTITDTLRARGYEGEYPHFRKMSEIKGIRLTEMQGQPVFVGNEKHMASMIDCFDCCTGSKTQPVGFNFTASTVFLKRDELHKFDSLDGLSGYFPHKHRRRARSVVPRMYHGEDDTPCSLTNSAIVAAKTAEIEKLTKEERKNNMSIGPGNYGFIFLLLMTLSLGTLFGIIFVPAMILFGFLVGIPLTLLLPDAPPFSEFIQMVFDFPWHHAFLFCVFGFGLPMAIFLALSKKRG